MNYNMNELNNILKTLPVGYYLKRNVTVEMDETISASYYDPMHDKICISFNQLSRSLSSIKDDKDLEQNVRTMLYHEVSHAFITPKEMRVTKVMNIFEDERIESILRHYYLNTNFREFVKMINNFKGEAPTTADSAFYQLVRYRIGDKKWLDELHELIKKFAHLTRNSQYWYDVHNYQDKVTDFYNRFVNDWNDKQENNSESEDENEESENENEESEDQTQTTESEDESEDESEESESEDSSEDEDEDESEETTESEITEPSEITEEEEYDEYDADVAQEIIEETLNEFNDSKLNEQIFQILSKIANSTKKNGSAINSYSGVFDPRSVARDDYRYFVQKNRLGHVKAFSKTKLNLFIDVSGSFYSSETTVNKLLYALSIFERQNPDFTYDVVKCQIGEKLCEKNDRQIKCGGGNFLDEKIFNLFNRLQDKNATVYNIVLFDGNAFTNKPYSYTKKECHKNFGAFNFKNTTIISDEDNREAIEKHCGSAKKIFTTNYASELIQNVLDTLQLIAR